MEKEGGKGREDEVYSKAGSLAETTYWCFSRRETGRPGVLLGNWVGTLSGRGASLFVPSVCAVLASSPPQAPGTGPWLPFPSPKQLSLTIKFSIFGVLVSYFPGTERRSERDWKWPFVLRSLPNFPIPSLCPFLLPRLALYPSPIFIYHHPI